jgi:NAD(P)-dependent dehydrogenase (short-subunit alcohol dehydrogenase family)
VTSLLRGKAVVVTGAGRGLGAAHARGCARRGASVVINDIDLEAAEATAAAIRADGGQALTCVADISTWAQAGRLIDTCLDAFGRIDGLVNNAAQFHWALLTDYDPEAAERLVRTNVLGALNCAGHAVKPMLAQGSGSIINTTSGAQMGMPKLGVYGATKGALASMVYTWAMELAGTGVRANAVSPIADTHPDAPDRQKAVLAPRPYRAPEANTPLVEFLLSDLAADISGQVIRMDGEKLSLCSHPAILTPPAIRETWTAEAIAEVFAGEFSDRMAPCGRV